MSRRVHRDSAPVMWRLIEVRPPARARARVRRVKLINLRNPPTYSRPMHTREAGASEWLWIAAKVRGMLRNVAREFVRCVRIGVTCCHGSDGTS
jgi:hypothetical protein